MNSFSYSEVVITRHFECRIPSSILGKRSFLHPLSHPQSFSIPQGGSLDSGLPFTCPGVDWKAVEASISLLKECDILKRLLGSVPYPPLLHPLNHLANIQCNQRRLLHLHLSPRAIWWVVVFSLMVKCLFWSSKSAHIMCHKMFQLKCRQLTNLYYLSLASDLWVLNLRVLHKCRAFITTFPDTDGTMSWVQAQWLSQSPSSSSKPSSQPIEWYQLSFLRNRNITDLLCLESPSDNFPSVYEPSMISEDNPSMIS